MKFLDKNGKELTLADLNKNRAEVLVDEPLALLEKIVKQYFAFAGTLVEKKIETAYVPQFSYADEPVAEVEAEITTARSRRWKNDK